MEMAAVVAWAFAHGKSKSDAYSHRSTFSLSQPCTAMHVRSALTRHDARGILHIIFSDDPLPRDICCFLPGSFAVSGKWAANDLIELQSFV